jgi:hypothetical protein
MGGGSGSSGGPDFNSADENARRDGIYRENQNGFAGGDTAACDRAGMSHPYNPQ